MQLRFEYQALCVGQVELSDRNDLPSAFTYPQIADGEFAWIAPVGIQRSILLVRPDLHERLDDRAALLLSDAFDEFLKRFRALAVAYITARNLFDDIGNVF